jgi:hypothetical protein
MASPLDERTIEQVIATDLAMTTLCELLREAQPAFAMKFAASLRAAAEQPVVATSGASDTLAVYASALCGSATAGELQ